MTSCQRSFSTSLIQNVCDATVALASDVVQSTKNLKDFVDSKCLRLLVNENGSNAIVDLLSIDCQTCHSNRAQSLFGRINGTDFQVVAKRTRVADRPADELGCWASNSNLAFHSLDRSGLMQKVTLTRQNHWQLMFIASGNDFRVFH